MLYNNEPFALYMLNNFLASFFVFWSSGHCCVKGAGLLFRKTNFHRQKCFLFIATFAVSSSLLDDCFSLSLLTTDVGIHKVFLTAL